MSSWSIPLLVEGRTIGLLGMGFYQARAFPEEERAFVETLTKRCAQAIQSAQLLAREESEAQTQQRDSMHRAFLAMAGEALASSLDYRGTLATVARLAVPQLADWCAVDLLEPDAREPEQLALAHVDPAKIALARELREDYPPDPRAGYDAHLRKPVDPDELVATVLLALEGRSGKR
jgi:K+-sensing histidine kinase KdpD